MNIPISTPLSAIVHHFSRYGELRHVKTNFSTRTNVMKALVRFKDPAAKEKVAAHQRTQRNNDSSRQPMEKQQTQRNVTPPR